MEQESFPAALPSASPSHMIHQPATHHRLAPCTSVSLITQGLPKKQMYSKERWQKMKPIIEELYFNKNQKFRVVRKYLQEHHDFHITTKQFTRKVSEWGLLKNVKRSEIPAILRNLGPASNGDDFEVTTIRGRKIDKSKIERWKKNSRVSKASSLALMPSTNTRSVSDPGPQTPAACLHLRDVIYVATNSGNINPVSPFRDDRIDWNIVDVVGSPSLSRFIGALSLEECGTIPFLDLSDTEEGKSSSHDPMDLLDTLESDHARKATDLLEPQLTVTQTMGYPNGSLKFHFSGFWPIPNPKNELCPFPTSCLSTARNSRTASSNSPAIGELECLNKMTALKAMTPAEIDHLVDNMGRIAAGYYNVSIFREAESWYRRMVTVTTKLPYHNQYKHLLACLMVVDCSDRRGEFNQAEDLHQGLRLIIQRHFPPDHEFAFLSRKIFAHQLARFGKTMEEERILREMLQICLNSRGLRHWETLSAMQTLGGCLEKNNKALESEQLLRTVVYLRREDQQRWNENVPNRHSTLVALGSLVRALAREGRLGENITEFVNIREWFGDMADLEDLRSWMFWFEIARARSQLGQASESEDIFRTLLRYHGEQMPPNLVCDTMKGLADTLRQDGRLQEAVIWYRKTFLLRAKWCGLEDWLTFLDTMDLGHCLAMQGRYVEALHHFQECIEEVQVSEDNGPGYRAEYIQTIQGLMRRVENKRIISKVDLR